MWGLFRRGDVCGTGNKWTRSKRRIILLVYVPVMVVGDEVRVLLITLFQMAYILTFLSIGCCGWGTVEQRWLSETREWKPRSRGPLSVFGQQSPTFSGYPLFPTYIFYLYQLPLWFFSILTLFFQYVPVPLLYHNTGSRMNPWLRVLPPTLIPS